MEEADLHAAVAMGRHSTAHEGMGAAPFGATLGQNPGLDNAINGMDFSMFQFQPPPPGATFNSISNHVSAPPARSESANRPHSMPNPQREDPRGYSWSTHEERLSSSATIDQTPWSSFSSSNDIDLWDSSILLDPHQTHIAKSDQPSLSESRFDPLYNVPIDSLDMRMCHSPMCHPTDGIPRATSHPRSRMSPPDAKVTVDNILMHDESYNGVRFDETDISQSARDYLYVCVSLAELTHKPRPIFLPSAQAFRQRDLHGRTIPCSDEGCAT